MLKRNCVNQRATNESLKRIKQDDAVAYINDALKQGTEISSFRKDKIGGDEKRTSYWYDGNTIIGHRLYKACQDFTNYLCQVIRITMPLIRCHPFASPCSAELWVCSFF
ncbi:hypothetical protein RchiOBHm_Chr2g0098451 [Rosa chinensis]|uniref:Uncharacterized protein n=1 Tax=Rosa chinensis TaxID=74649 RepID=A0A2P6RLL2_ROSCH|nr:hypothetical protein RchiOBHm_Chr2g0098451 [Rosa chinensis]